jgi:hypothetical protein
MYLLSLTFILAGLFIYVSHRRKWLMIYLMYTVLLYLVLAAVEGFTKTDPDNFQANMVFLIMETIIFLLHIPFIIRLSQLDTKNERVKHARRIFEKDVAHLHDDKLHRHLGHE